MGTEKRSVEVKRAELIACANELNTVLDLDPKIKVVAVKTDALIEAIMAGAKLLVADDEITQEAIETLTALKIDLPEGLGAEQEEQEKTGEVETPGTEPTVEQMIILIDEMNTVLNLDPQIETADKMACVLKADIMQNCYDKGECQIFPEDNFTPEAWATLKVLGVNPVVEEVEDKPPVTEKKKPEEKTPAPEPKKDKKSSSKPTSKKTAEKPPKTAHHAKKVVEAYTRSHALIDALQAGSGTREEIVAASDKLFVKNGGATNTNVANYMFGYVMPSLKILNIVEQDGKTFTWKK